MGNQVGRWATCGGAVERLNKPDVWQGKRFARLVTVTAMVENGGNRCVHLSVSR